MQHLLSLTTWIALAAAFFAAASAPAFAADPDPGQYKVDTVFSGRTKMPQFKGRDKAYKDFRTRIRAGLKSGPNFDGHYSVIEFGCGSGCLTVLIADNRTGRVYDAPDSGENNMYLTLQYQKDSRLMVAQWASYDKNTCNIDFIAWNEGKSKLLSTRVVGVTEDCYKDIKDNLAK